MRSGLPRLEERLLEVDTRIALNQWQSSLDQRSLEAVKRSVVAALEERAECVHDLEAVIENLDAKLAKRY